MISRPSPGMPVRIHYRAAVAPHMPYHGRTGRVVLAARSRPRNHGVRLDGADDDAASAGTSGRKGPTEARIIVVPAGNLQREGGAPRNHAPENAEEAS